MLKAVGIRDSSVHCSDVTNYFCHELQPCECIAYLTNAIRSCYWSMFDILLLGPRSYILKESSSFTVIAKGSTHWVTAPKPTSFLGWSWIGNLTPYTNVQSIFIIYFYDITVTIVKFVGKKKFCLQFLNSSVCHIFDTGFLMVIPPLYHSTILFVVVIHCQGCRMRKGCKKVNCRGSYLIKGPVLSFDYVLSRPSAAFWRISI